MLGAVTGLFYLGNYLENNVPLLFFLFFVLFFFFTFDQLIQGGKGEAIRIRAILRSLIPVQDLEGVINIGFQLPYVAEG